MKQVAEDGGTGRRDGDSQVRRQEVDEVEEFDGLELGLSLGRRGWKAGLMDNGANDSRQQELDLPLEQGIGSSWFHERQVPQRPFTMPENLRSWGEELVAEVTKPQDRDVSLQDETFLDMEGAGQDRNRDAKHKRPKVFSSSE